MDEQVTTPCAAGGMTLWMTGLSGAGKTTLTRALRTRLLDRRVACCLLDGDVIRTGLTSDLGFSPADRQENIRRVAEVAKIVNSMGAVAIVALISPLRDDRALARTIVGAERFLEVFVDAPVSTCIARDPKGLYRRALAGELKAFTGISAPYEAPLSPDVRVSTSEFPVDVCVQRIDEILVRRLTPR